MKNKSALFKNISSSRYDLFLRGQFEVFAGYSIAIIETFIAARIGLTPISYGDALVISSCVLTITLVLLTIVYFKKTLLLWQELLIFSIHMLGFVIFFSLWVYKLEGARIISLLTSVMAVAVILSYTRIIQSLIMSLSAVLCYLAVTSYAILVAGQPGSLVMETFLAICMIPLYVVIAWTAGSLNRYRSELENTHVELEKANRDLRGINSVMKRTQYLIDLEMDMAYNIQTSIFPAKPPAVTGWDIAFYSKPGYGVSGDFHDFYCTDDRLDGIALFDVSGHGLASALITILTKPILHRHFMHLADDKLGKVIDAVNADMKEQLETVNIFITGIVLRMTGDNLEYVNAGHPAMLCRQSESGRVHVVTDVEGKFKGRPLGIGPLSDHYTTLKFPVRKGDILLLYSDCFIECLDVNGEQYGLEKLALALADAPADTADSVLDYIMGRYNSHVADEKISDDLSVIVVRKI